MGGSSLFDSLNGPTDIPASVCSFTSENGTRCMEDAVEGETVCVLHGASVVRAKDQVQRRLLALQEKSIKVAESLLLGSEDKVRASIVVAIWDRTGLGPKSTIVLDKKEDLSGLDETTIVNELDNLTKVAKAEVNRRRMNEAMKRNPNSANTKH